MRFGLSGSLLIHALVIGGVVYFSAPPSQKAQMAPEPLSVDLVPLATDTHTQKGAVTGQKEAPPRAHNKPRKEPVRVVKKTVKKTQADTPPLPEKQPQSSSTMGTPVPENAVARRAVAFAKVAEPAEVQPPVELPEASAAPDLKPSVPREDKTPEAETFQTPAFIAHKPSARPHVSSQKKAPPQMPPQEKERLQPLPQKSETAERSDFSEDAIRALLNKVEPSKVQESPFDPTAAQASVRLGHEKAPDTPPVTLSQSEVDALRSQISACWMPPVGALDAENVVVVMRVLFDPDGRLFQAPERLNRQPHPLFEAMAQSAERALVMCQPYSLPPEKYAIWNTTTITFDLKEMLGV